MTDKETDNVYAWLEDELNEAILKRQTAYTLYLCRKILDDYPDDAFAWLVYSRSLMELRRFAEAENALDRAEENGDKNVFNSILVQRARLAHSKREFEEAEKLFLQLHFLSPYWEWLVGAAEAAFERGEVSRAEELARKAVACAYRHNTEPTLKLAYYLACQLRFREALDCYQQVLEVDPKQTVAKEKIEDITTTLAAIKEDQAELNQQEPSASAP